MARTEPAGDLLGHAAAEPLGDVLRQERDAQPLLALDQAVVGGDLAVDQAQERRLALAVAAEQADPLAPLDLEVGTVEQPRPTEGEPNLAQAQQCHECDRPGNEETRPSQDLAVGRARVATSLSASRPNSLDRLRRSGKACGRIGQPAAAGPGTFPHSTSRPRPMV